MPEWMELVYESKIIHGYFTDKEVKLAFVWSRMISVDDCSSTNCACTHGRYLHVI